MPELLLHREGSQLIVQLGERTAAVPWQDVVFNEQRFKSLRDDAVAYGRTLFDATFRDERLRTDLLALRTGERLLLVSEDAEVSMIPWEYLRRPDGQLLAGQLNLLRGIPAERRRSAPAPVGPVEILALTESPVDEAVLLNTEREWRNLVEVVQGCEKRLKLTRVRPPTLGKLRTTLPGEGMTIVNFMGHSGHLEGREAVLVFEEMDGRGKVVKAADFAAELDEHVFLVLLNSCYSAVATATEFGNIAQGLVRQGIPYALGMQFALPDEAALVLSQQLYEVLVRGRGLEEAIRRLRRSLLDDTRLDKPAFLAGIPVLYTALHEPATSLPLESGKPTIQPDPQRLQETCDVVALPRAELLLGRAREMSAAMELLLAPSSRGFIVLHGLGGIGKTSLARALAERVSWYYTDRVLAYSFETFATLDDTSQRWTVSETFVDRFLTRLAGFYGLEREKYQHS